MNKKSLQAISAGLVLALAIGASQSAPRRAARPKPGSYQPDAAGAAGPIDVGNWPAVQPISAATLPLPTGAATETSLAMVATNTGRLPSNPATDRTTAGGPFASRLSDGGAFYDAAKTGQFPAGLVGGRLDVNVGNSPTVTANAGSGTYTIGGTVGVNNFPATQPVTGTFWQATQPVSGTFWQATQPVSGTVTANTGTLPALTKGTQGAAGFSTQDLKDAGRASVMLTAEAVAGATTEALITLTQSKSGGATTTGTNYPVAAGKTLRLQAIVVTFVSTTTTANTTRLRLRVNTGGAVALTSPLALSFRLGWPSATFIANEATTLTLPIPDGLEFPAGAGVGITHQEAAANGTIDVSAVAYEF